MNKNDKNPEEDIVLEHDSDLDDSVVAEENQIETIKKLREKLKNTEAEKQEYLSGWQRTKADFINLRKQDESDKQRILKFAKEELIVDLIPIIDSFDSAFANKESWLEVSEEWRRGMESLYQKLLNALASHGVTKESPLNEVFDPNKHEAMQTVPVTKKEKDNIIVSVLRPGYIYKEKIIRPAKVSVGEYKG